MKRRAYAKKRDANELEIIAALKKIGCEVEPLEGAEGMPDLLVALGNRLFLIEVKNQEGRNKVEKGQEKFHKRFPVTVVRTVGEAIALVNT